ncbi:hypothetical protein DSO57_1028600 [Entomophthora muscae]|uniref:Uncharacterized protein n=1 Tax=Entomophthora muscae TaxID=34485 RepID=A0ACC2SE26_9FUNG|nr:hypothetical protein DSO57_1028600 [Entomophthora muscae]
MNHSGLDVRSLSARASPEPKLTGTATKGWHKHIKSSFGIKPRYNTFYEHLKVQQGKTVASIRDIENCHLRRREPPVNPAGSTRQQGPNQAGL